MTIDESNELKPEFEVEYKGPLGFTLFWFIWSFFGYLYMVLLSESPSSSLEWFYLVLTILSVMALNNRKYGINHSIRFYSDHVIVPRLLNSWFWIPGFEFIGLESWAWILGRGFMGLDSLVWIHAGGFLGKDSWVWTPGL